MKGKKEKITTLGKTEIQAGSNWSYAALISEPTVPVS
jgi:hypothetical protein